MAYAIIKYKDLVEPSKGRFVEFDEEAAAYIVYGSEERAREALAAMYPGIEDPMAYAQARVEEVEADSPYFLVRY
jgi:hypothetical protein